jgi:drug/metabolite transporter (DMT)-like permease
MPFVGEFSALLTAFMWSGTAIVFSEATSRVGTIQVNITRMLLALILLVGTVFLLGLDYGMSRQQVLNLTWSGIIGLVIGDTFLFRAFKDIGPRISMLVMSLVPAITAVLGWFLLAETLSLPGIVGMTITIMGITMVILDRQPAGSDRYRVTAKGLVFAILGAAGQATGLIFAKFALNESPLHGMVATTVRIAAAIVLFLPAAYLFRWYRNPFTVYGRDRKALGYTDRRCGDGTVSRYYLFPRCNHTHEGRHRDDHHGASPHHHAADLYISSIVNVSRNGPSPEPSSPSAVSPFSFCVEADFRPARFLSPGSGHPAPVSCTITVSSGVAIPSLLTYALLLAAGFFGGLVDAMAGGGGLITLPALLAAGLPPHVALATNKVQSAIGTTFSASATLRSGYVILPLGMIGFVSSSSDPIWVPGQCSVCPLPRSKP